jgi:hypothetical protein
VTTEQIDTLVFKDQAGGYYLVPKELLDSGRVPRERAAEIERAIAAATEGGAGGADTQGHFFFTPLALVFAGAILAGTAGGIALGREIWGPEQTVPSLDYSHFGEDTTPR